MHSKIKLILALALASPLAAFANNTQSLPTGSSIPLATDTSDTANDTIYLLATPGSYAYGNSPTAGTTFYDNYYFYISPSQVDSITAAISTPVGSSSVGVTNPESRLFSWAPGQAIPFPDGAINAGGGNGTLLVGWAQDTSSTQMINGSMFDVTSFSDSNVTAGYYVLQISGTVDPLGGNYTGSLNLSSVPLPGSAALALSGIALIAALAWRQRARIGSLPGASA